jgi:predicted nucleic acid-binding protein
LIVAALTNEARTSDAQAWLQAQPLDGVTISEWTITEFSSALSLKLRVGAISADQRALALASFSRLAERSFQVVAVTGAMFRKAATLADQYSLAIRAGDALHLAAALDHGVTVWTLDERIARAGPALGVATRLL